MCIQIKLKDSSFIKHLVKGIIIFITISIVFIVLFSRNIYNYLAIQSPVNANTLLVEGWLADQTFHKIIDEFNNGNYEYIITTGLPVSDFYKISMNSSLIFDTKKTFINSSTRENKIGVIAYGELGGSNKSHLNVFFNDSLVSDFYVDKKPNSYNIYFTDFLYGIDSITLSFDNDSMGKFGDRNIYIKGLLVNDSILISYKKNSKYYRSKKGWEKYQFLDYSNYAELSKNKLVNLGVNVDQIITVPCINHSKLRTYSCAKSFKKWSVTNSNILNNCSGINIITEDVHSRKTLLAYSTLLNNEPYKIGIIPTSSSYKSDNQITKIVKLIDNMIDVGIYKLLLIFY